MQILRFDDSELDTLHVHLDLLSGGFRTVFSQIETQIHFGGGCLGHGGTFSANLTEQRCRHWYILDFIDATRARDEIFPQREQKTKQNK